ncbi:MAG: EamA family transporter [Synergistaceae bacterium]|nr:EamA family transporter [Synergistaceae bacterium]MBQ3398269.1 EamA family transporter [Synergistaceae bacterium]MBQ4401628.1 EamA family transporter [Synergistaceae bacterium]MBQ6114219.1 EamA family transporter [Synergistaceae bacterium]MBQ6417319.1 EamA family transporter [Synergistaceae bacterium]
MWGMLWPLLLIIISNCFYNICTKSIPENTDAFGTLVITYIAGALIAFVMFWSHSGDFSISRNFNWPSVILGFAIVGLEAGYVYLFRAGWQISKGSLTANICLAIVLLFVGLFMYGEKISLRQIIGALVCMAGLYMINAQ